LQGEDKIRSVYDPCCGTGGMLTIGKEWIRENINKNLKIELFGQELNDATYAICKSDFLMSNENPENIKGPFSSLSLDGFSDRKFDYMITNPPFGVSWKSEEEFVKQEAKNLNGRFTVGIPRTTDGSLLFLQHLISKMEPLGSRIGIVFNGSPLFSGDAGSGESEIRKWIFTNDLLETIIQLPDSIFFNTSITTYLWIVTNKKTSKRKGKVQLIDGSNSFKIMKKSLGSKRKEMSEDGSNNIVQSYLNFEENDISKIYENSYFGYTKVQVEQPLVQNGKIIKLKSGELKPDTKLRDYEKVPLDKSIDEYFKKEVKPFLPNAWMDRSKDKVGYEINFTKSFYRYESLRSSHEITNDLLKLENESRNLLNQILKS